LKRCVRFSSFPAQSQSDFLPCPWTKCAADPKYDDFKDALEQALEKVDEYYHKALARRSPGRPSDRYGNGECRMFDSGTEN
jgi:hypothetical protein